MGYFCYNPEMTENASRIYPAMPNALAERIQKAIPDIHKQRNETIFKAGDSARSLYVVRKGIVFSRQSDEKAQRSFIDHVFHPGQIVGVEAVVSENAYRSTAVSANNSEMVSIHQAEMEALVAEYPLFFLQLVTYHIRELEQLRQRFKLPISERVLVSIEEFRNGNNLVSVDQSVIAERSGGADRSSVNAALSEQGIVWEQIADPSLIRSKEESRRKIESVINKYVRKIKKVPISKSMLAEESGLSVSTVSSVMNEMGITIEDLSLQLSEYNAVRILRTIAKYRDEAGNISRSAVYIAEELGISISTIRRVLVEKGIRWDDYKKASSSNKHHMWHVSKSERVLLAIKETKNSDGYVDVSQGELARIAGVGRTTLWRVLSKEGLSWDQLTGKQGK